MYAPPYGGNTRFAGPNDICLQCMKYPKRKDFTFCSKDCSTAAARAAPKLIKIPSNHVMYQSGTACKGEQIFPAEMKSSVSVRNGELATLVSPDNSHYVTTAIAGYAMRYVLASNPASRTNGRSHRWVPASDLVMASTQLRRRPSGSLFSPFMDCMFRITPEIYSRAFDYAVNIHNQSRVKTVIYSRVVLGRSFMMVNEMPSLWSPPLGFDSVEGRPGPGSQFDDLECVVYDENAILPAYLITLGSCT
ncbi:hypothetical protein AZE42_09559 [Rhizopogon vesiculosus]|uniref:Uncharacterized protein n=1 Tax=Rhizopogon vesiculosus TaxID=180088 RepID=A0A1J8QAQ6_9AGAM|nr:hypothetical protein AZE42_09559 [Rhizopogon vesiculosus]